MNDILTQILGENGPSAGQVAIATTITLALLGLLVWGVRRLSHLRLGTRAHARVPRLAIVDVLPLDSRRQLLLVRRDNVEHLILVGGPSDLVVEPSITRTRQRPAQAATNGAATSAPPPLPATLPNAAPGTGGMVSPSSPAPAAADGDTLLPFPFVRIPPALPRSPAGKGATPPDDAARQSAFAPAPSWSGPSTIRPVLDAGPDGVGAAMPVAPRTAVAPPRVGRPAAPAPFPTAGNAAAPAVPGPPGSVLEDGPSHKVGGLEAEMNRLLGQISPDRRSS